VIIVFDSGVWISAMQFGGTPLRAIERAFVADQLAVCDQIVNEIRATLVRKFLWRDDEVREILSNYLSEALQAKVEDKLHGVCRDPKDDMVFECAVVAEATMIVSGDRDLLAISSYRSMRVLTPRQYLEEAGT
jgi:putative PIN family toxin of toxin-antitoxin system